MCIILNVNWMMLGCINLIVPRVPLVVYEIHSWSVYLQHHILDSMCLLLKGGVHPKVASERLGHTSVSITLVIYSHVLPGLQEAAVEKLDQILMLEDMNSTPNVSK